MNGPRFDQSVIRAHLLVAHDGSNARAPEKLMTPSERATKSVNTGYNSDTFPSAPAMSVLTGKGDIPTNL